MYVPTRSHRSRFAPVSVFGGLSLVSSVPKESRGREKGARLTIVSLSEPEPRVQGGMTTCTVSEYSNIRPKTSCPIRGSQSRSFDKLSRDSRELAKVVVENFLSFGYKFIKIIISIY
jgi:hypothetical protein